MPHSKLVTKYYINYYMSVKYYFLDARMWENIKIETKNRNENFIKFMKNM